MNIFARHAGIRAKLVSLFVLIKVVPLLALAWLIWSAMTPLVTDVEVKVGDMAGRMQETAGDVGRLAVDEAVTALDHQAQEAIERQTVDLAQAVAAFLYSVDRDIVQLAALEADAPHYGEFLDSRQRYVPEHGPWRLNADGDGWEAAQTAAAQTGPAVTARLPDNAREFHYTAPFKPYQQTLKPQYLEAAFVDLQGHEQIRVTRGDLLGEPVLRDLSERSNTFLKADYWFPRAAALGDGEIYVSEVIGAYVGSPLIGSYTPEKVAQAGVPFEPEQAAYAGKENPLGKRFRGIVRWVKPVLRDGQRVGYVTLALDHAHLMAFTDHRVPTPERFSDISDAGSGNYAFMWDYLGRNISHPRDYFIVGYDPQTGEQVAPWLDQDSYARWQASGQSFAQFSATLTPFADQSLSLKPSAAQIKEQQLALDCRYLKFAPQCSGWWNLTRNGGSGSFVIFWSGIWKLTTAAAIPYYTGRYGDNERGFGVVTIGANVPEFHSAATRVSGQIDAILAEEGDRLAEQRQALGESIDKNVSVLFRHLSLSTSLMVLVVMAIAIWMATYLTDRILKLNQGIGRFSAGDLRYRFPVDSRDEMGQLSQSLNAMAESLEKAVTGLKKQIAKRRDVERVLERVNQNLEDTVRRRTEQLEQSNQALQEENEERRKAEQRMSYLAQYDDLTGLANRVLFRDQLDAAYARCEHYGEPFALLFVDLDKFKEVNDNLGHDVGDQLLQHVGKVFRDAVRGNDSAARLGGDEFALIVGRLNNHGDVALLAGRILQQLLTPLELEGHAIQIGASIGISVYPQNADSTDELLRQADLAMYQAKEEGGNTYRFYVETMQEDVQRLRDLERDLAGALSAGQLRVHYQPKVEVGSGAVVGAEALVRWYHDERGMIGPEVFIPMAEKSGLIHRLGDFVLEQACQQNQAWREQGLPAIPVSVNVSALQLQDPCIVSRIKALLQRYGMAPSMLELELTESSVMLDQYNTSARLVELQASGIPVSIDDFGSGYSSFDRLTTVKANVVKIDRSFISQIGEERGDAVVQAIVRMVQALGIPLVAEGVETREQLEFLRELGCEQYQGYFYSQAVPAEEFAAFLAAADSGQQARGA
ncbi:EAL domain-containing protein [Granulosicoccaceae sp. 1_MG-2023]|nr:EAL domain-containing protein [Granulosicoccaceae sp. 1_MG-2023]